MKVIFYLQEKKVLPSVRELQVGAEEYLIGRKFLLTIISKSNFYHFFVFVLLAWKANFCDKSLRDLNIERNDDFILHLIGFFDYYSTFDYDENVICPYLGYTVSKSVFDLQKKKFIPELKPYNDYIETIDVEEVDSRDCLFDLVAPLCTQDPFELCHNVTRNFKMSSIHKFVDLCKLSKNILNEKKF